MSGSHDVSRRETFPWRSLVKGAPPERLVAIYDLADRHVRDLRAWYWASAHRQRWRAVGVRGVGFVLGLVGVAAPLASAAVPERHRLLVTQLGVAAIALAGVAQLADRIFGWSSGWLRSVSAATVLEQRTVQFELDWAQHCVSRDGALDERDLDPLFKLARAFMSDADARRVEETRTWTAEFQSGTAALQDLARVQREREPSHPPASAPAHP